MNDTARFMTEQAHGKAYFMNFKAWISLNIIFKWKEQKAEGMQLKLNLN